jgi:ABC-type polysaccharide/polyol phosphate export permease
MISMALVLMGLHSWTVTSALYPAYIFCINLTFVTIVGAKLSTRIRRVRRIWQARAIDADVIGVE